MGVSMDQALRDDIGVFFKGMWADGQTETLAFTEIDRSLALGTSIKGSRWQRPDDTIGLALMRHFLSPERREYLALGGLSFFIGDGLLNYHTEDIFEGYYSLAVGKQVWLTVDYQRINNPAYNADRGPVDICSTRFHAEF
jgi:carbohydrate-selective porin OprB